MHKEGPNGFNQENTSMAGLYIQCTILHGDDPLNLSLAITTDMEPLASWEIHSEIQGFRDED